MKVAFVRRPVATALTTAALATVVLAFAAGGSAGIAAHVESTLTRLGVLRSSPASVSAYVTTGDGARLFSRDVIAPRFSTSSTGNLPVITVNQAVRFQTIDGFGAALTGSSAYLLSRLPDGGAAVLSDLFGTGGIGLSYVRLTVAASDFSLGSYTYDDVAPGQTDAKLKAFSMTRDVDVLAEAKLIRAASADVRFMASPWTAPAWMKTGDGLFGGTLRPEFYNAYARYLVAYVRTLQSQGIALDALTPQNEPMLSSGTYPSMTLGAPQERTFIATALGPAMQSAYPSVKLVVSDHNWEETYPATVMRDPAAARYVAGSAFHCYGGQPAQMSGVHALFPQAGVYLDECSGGGWSPVFGDNLRWDVENLIVGGTSNWARTVLLGNLALDDAAGPTNGGCSNCRGVVTVHSDGSVTRNVEYYVLAHAAKFVRPGAVRVASGSPLGAALPNVAFVNVDGSTVLIVFNASKRRTSFAVRDGNGAFRYALPANSVTTLRWNA
jgi:glucosylceramidase